MKRWVLWLTGVVMVAGGIWACDRETVMVWDGGFELAVDIAADVPPETVVLVPFGRWDEESEALVRHPAALAEFHPGAVRPFDGRPMTVWVWESGRRSMTTGRELTHFQMRHLAVAARWPDGRWAGQRVDIPNGRESKSVQVRFPNPPH